MVKHIFSKLCLDMFTTSRDRDTAQICGFRSSYAGRRNISNVMFCVIKTVDFN